MTLPLTPLGLMGRTEPPSFPVLRSTSNNNPGTVNTTHSVSLPDGIADGDLVLLAYCARSSFAMTSMPTPADWNSIALYDSSSVVKVRIIYRIATGALSTVTVTSPGANSHIVSNGYCFSKFSGVPVASEFITDTSDAPDPPDLAPPGWGTNPRAMWISLFVTTSGAVSVSSTSSGFTDTINSNGGSSPFSRMQSSRREERSASLNPGPWALSGSAFWCAATIAVRGR